MPALPIRAKLALLCAGAVAIAIVAASVLAWVATREALRDQVDASLNGPGQVRIRTMLGGLAGIPNLNLTLDQQIADLCAPGTEGRLVGGPAETRMQVVFEDGSTCSPFGTGDEAEVTAADLEVASGEQASVLRDGTTNDGEHVRVRTVQMADGVAMMSTRSLAEVDAATRQLAIVLTLAGLCGVLAAAAAGLFVALVVLRPVRQLTAAAEHVAATEDLDVPIPVEGRDEVARLSTAFNAMTSRLSRSRERQRQLIADASHELRTPLTSLRTNLEWLMRSEAKGRPLDAAQRRQVEQAVLGQMDELSTLIAEVGALAREEPVRARGPVDLDAVALRAVERAQRRDPGRRFELDLEPWPVLGHGGDLERACLNLLDNALKFSTGPIRVTLAGGRLTVSDQGPGLSDAAQAKAFDRFWRAPEARELPGSGLGLAIVESAAVDHGGTVFFTNAPWGGSAVGFELPSANGAVG
ncbi:HAMP domain-containing sensor histidine kinase [Nocardioides speluncae]|uniref:HAMP domain-containing sensor histidine kinase n=1 Tax=Nocardioides speluncae TaxID=2670337 RepID=UPI000D691F50|nr:HAMP domain-containing sensor histidine kinase [Nocardioides speluncae]